MEKSSTVLDRLLRGEDQAQHVEVELPVEVLGRHFFERREFVNAGVVDQYIEPAECLFRLGEQALDVGGPGHIGLHGDRPAAFACDLGNDAVSSLLAGGVVDHHGRPLVSQVLRNRSADALRCTGNDGDLGFKSLRHGVAPFRGSGHCYLLISDSDL
jgi:hypothetical protein